MDQTTTEQARFLVIDDEEIIVKSMRSILKLEGYTADAANSASEGLSLIRKNSYEIVFLDLKLPDSNGIEVLKDIRKADSELIVIIITGYATIKSAISALKLNAYDYILKPLDPDQIRSSLRSAMKKRKVETEVKKRIQEPKVLLVKAGSDVIGAIAQRLVKEKVQRFLVKNSSEALQLLKKEPSINTVLYDIESEKTDGVEFLEEAKKINPEIVFIPVTSRPNLQEVINLMKRGAFDYLVKPVKDEDLFLLLKQAWNYQSLSFINKQLVHSILETGESLRKTHLYLSTVMMMEGMSFMVLDREHRIMLINKEFSNMLGYREEELVGKPVHTLFDEKEGEPESKMERVLQKADGKHLEKKYLTRQGRSVPVLFSFTTLLSEQGEPEGKICLGKAVQSPGVD